MTKMTRRWCEKCREVTNHAYKRDSLNQTCEKCHTKSSRYDLTNRVWAGV